MEEDQTQGEKEDRNIQQEIFASREFSLAEVIGREGGDFLKGESPVPKLVQATTAINTYIALNLHDSLGALQAVLQIWVKEDRANLSHYLDSPLVALKALLEKILNNQELLYELVRQVDFKWGQIYDERPYFQQPGQAANRNDEYTHQSVSNQLMELFNKLNHELS